MPIRTHEQIKYILKELQVYMYMAYKIRDITETASLTQALHTYNKCFETQRIKEQQCYFILNTFPISEERTFQYSIDYQYTSLYQIQ